MTRPLPLLLLGTALVLLHTGPAVAAEPAGLRLRSYETQQGEIQALNDSGRFPLRSYALAKSQCWLDVSFHEYTRNDRSAFPAQAWAQSHLITRELAASGQSATAAETPLVNGATRLRPDLWTRLATLKDADGYSCAEALVACAEVELVHAGNEFRQIGWRHAKPYVQIAEDRVQEAASAAGRCAAQTQVAGAPAPAPRAEPVAEPAAAPAAPPRTREVSLAADALFRFDRRSPEDLLPEGKARLDEFATELARDYARIERIRLVGHTDRLGKPAYNERLSLDRANTVRRYLESRGVMGPFETSGVGSTAAVAECHGTPRSAVLHDCLQSDRRVDIAIVGVPREPGHDVW